MTRVRPACAPRLLAAVVRIVIGSLALSCSRSVGAPPVPPAPPSLATTHELVTVSPPQRVVARAYHAMGTEVTLTAYVADEALAVQAFAAAENEIVRIERLMTDWERPGVPPSDIIRVNAAAGNGLAILVSSETFEVVAQALDMSRRSGGAFDITFAAMHGLWKFDEDLEPRVPAAAEIARRKRLVNWRDVVADPDSLTVQLRRVGMRVGLGGIAKGYAVDRASAVLRARGLANFMVQAGGDLYVSGTKGGAHWMVGVRDPRGGPRDVIATMPIENHAFSTAGDYERSFVVGGRRYHHIIDPKTGYPATASREVTIFAPTAFLADALDDAVFILGPEKGLALCKQFPDTSALIVDARNRVWVSPELDGKLKRTAKPGDGI